MGMDWDALNAESLAFLTRWSKDGPTDEIREQAQLMIDTGCYFLGEGLPLGTDPETGWPTLFEMIANFQEEENGD